MNLAEQQFLDGTIGVRVFTLEQSKYVIKWAEEHGYPREDADEMFDADTYLDYPYYFIELDYQLQANQTEGGALDDVEEVVDFEVVFGEL